MSKNQTQPQGAPPADPKPSNDSKPAEPSAKPPEKTEDEPKASASGTYHVRGPGLVHVGGKNYRAGDTLELSSKEAASLGALVAPGGPPAKKEKLKPKASDLYTITGPGSICLGGKFLGEGELVELSAADATAFADRIELATS